MGDTSGSIRSVSLDSIAFDAMADANVTANLSTEREGTATSGRTMMKVTKKVATREAVDLACNPQEYEVLKALHARLDVFPLAITYADSSVYQSTGSINAENHESETNKCTIILIPQFDWLAFLN